LYNPSDINRERRLERLTDFNSVVLAMAGHDLRQPLQVLAGAFSSLSRHVDAAHRRHIEYGEKAIAQLTAQLDRLVEAIQLGERTAAGELAPVQLGPLLGDLRDDFAEAAQQKAIGIKFCQTHAIVLSDRTLLTGILRNLVHNAIKYTQPGGRVLFGCRRCGPDIRVEVYDTGIGIQAEHVARIFNAFQRIDITRYDGMGLGLFIVRRAAKLLGHRVDVRSSIGRGTCFSISAKSFVLTNCGSGDVRPRAFETADQIQPSAGESARPEPTSGASPVISHIGGGRTAAFFRLV
jgi:two-component system phosphate regulon sensor histidine kinase PhoR